MGDIVALKEVPEPEKYKGRERFFCGWRTDAVGKWLISKKLDDEPVQLSEIAYTVYTRDTPSNRQKVKGNASPLRRWLAGNDEFLLVFKGYRGRVEALKVCNFLDKTDRQMAKEQLDKLVATGEYTFTEASRWEKRLVLTSTSETA